MQVHSHFFQRAMLGVTLTLGWAGVAAAAPLNLNYSTTYDGTSINTVNTGNGVNNLAVPASYYYGNTYTSATTVIPGSTTPPGYGFYDDYIFTISGAAASSVTTTIDLGNLLKITDLQERIYSYNGNTVPSLGTPNGTVYQSLTTSFGVGSVAVISNLILNPGTYVLEVRGNAVGAAGGSYAGTLNLAAVPVPAALPLLLSGMGLLGGAIRRRTNV
ncbi:MAG TPA: FxDxF family PEP-CTERM protein [Pseudomonadales bacterium]|nr:FxDxF family PEP-CTERM protein [Pseudomonadales bacterium]